MEATSVHLHICFHGFIVLFYTVCALLLFGNNKLEVTEWNMLRDSFGAIRINETSEEGSWIYWMTDVENGAARREEAHRGDSWIGAGVTEVDVKDGVRWRQRICCGDP